MKKLALIVAIYTVLFSLVAVTLPVWAEEKGGELTMTVTKNETKREEISLNGIWECQDMPFGADISELPKDFNNTIPVPGLWDLAEKPFEYTSETMALRENYKKVALWYKKILTFEGDIPARVTLKMHKAFWGKYIYVNGEFVAEHQPNFTAAYIDITDYLKGNGEENELLIKIGDKGTQPFSLGHPTGYDAEKSCYVPGIYDDVKLILSGEPHIDYIQVAPNIHNSTAKVKLTVTNSTETDAVSDIRFTVTDDNVYLKSAVVSGVEVKGGETKDIYAEVDMSGFEYWSPESPKLYNINAATDSDMITDTFGMREFYFDEETGNATLNGEYRYLIGTNVCFYRFLEDPLRADLPWNEEWVRSVLIKFKEMNMSFIRFTIGFVPDFWYDLCDELGIMVADEWAIWGTYECQPHLYNNGNSPFLQEVTDWINERANHPSVVVWDINNETFKEDKHNFYPELGEVIDWARAQGLDMSERPWDNGYHPPRETTDTVEVHPYLFINASFKISHINLVDYDPVHTCDCLHFFNDTQSRDPLTMPDNPRVINEYEWLWITRDGTPCYLTETLYKNIFPNGYTEADLRYYSAKANAALAEFWRVGQKTVGLLGFCGLTYSRPGGYTCDNFLPDLANPQYHETYAKLVGDAYKDVLICIEDWTEFRRVGEQSVPVTIINDTTSDIEKEVTLKLYKGSKMAFSLDEYTLVSTSSQSFSVAANGGRTSIDFTVDVPKDKCVYKLVASYVDEDGDTVDSVRDFEIGEPIPKQSDTNRVISQGCNVTVSSTESEDLKPENLVDGDNSSRWSSKFTDKEWVQLDLGEVCDITSVFILWEAGAPGKSYEILLSEDGQTWTKAKTIRNGAYPNASIDVEGRARYVKFDFKARYSGFGYSIYEIKVFGKPETEKYAVAAMIMGDQSVGKVSGSTYVKAGESASLTAEPSEGYIFKGWKVRGEFVSGEMTYSYTPDQDTVIYGVFSKPYTCTVTVTATEGGTASGGGHFDAREAITLSAVANEGYRFTGWMAGKKLVSTDAVYELLAIEDKEYTAVFEKITADVTDTSESEAETTAPESESISTVADDTTATAANETVALDDTTTEESNAGCKSSASALGAAAVVAGAAVIAAKKKEE